MPTPRKKIPIEMTKKNCYARGEACESCYDPRKCYGCSTDPDLCHCGEDSDMKPISCFDNGRGDWVGLDPQPMM